MLLSNSFSMINVTHKTGTSYRYKAGKTDFSFGMYYQLIELRSNQLLPLEDVMNTKFKNFLPTATLSYKMSKRRNLQCNYSTSTQIPQVRQLQNVIDNRDPIHIYLGNPSLQPPYKHNLTARYTATSKSGMNHLSCSLTRAVTEHAIVSNVVVATVDTLLPQNIFLHKGSQLTTPENIESSRSLNASASYGLPLTYFKCNLDIGTGTGISHEPAVINGITRLQNTCTSTITMALSSNITYYLSFIWLPSFNSKYPHKYHSKCMDNECIFFR
jgi:hypothetical protein